MLRRRLPVAVSIVALLAAAGASAQISGSPLGAKQMYGIRNFGGGFVLGPCVEVSQTVINTPGPGTFTTPAYTCSVDVEAWGGGQSGSTGYALGGGGGGIRGRIRRRNGGELPD